MSAPAAELARQAAADVERVRVLLVDVTGELDALAVRLTAFADAGEGGQR